MQRFRPFAGAAIGLLAVLCLATTNRGAQALLRLREDSQPFVRVDQCPVSDAIAVLSGDGAPRFRRLGPQETSNRSEAGIALWHAGRGTTLIFTSGGLEGGLNRTGAITDGVPPDRILVVGPARNTAEEADLMVRAAGARHWHRLILVTSGFHMARSRLLIESAARKQHASLTVFPFRADGGSFFFRSPGLTDYVPGSSGLERLLRVFREVEGEWACRAGIC
jgi:uncharacterized SAM-binding protein YcdF (DUF218 family)